MGTEQSPGLCRRALLALELVPGGPHDRLQGWGRDGGAERRRGATPSLGLLDVLPPPPAARPDVEPQTRVSGL